MKSIIFFLMFTGLLFIIHGIYQQKYDELKNNVRVEYRFIPRSFYEEQMSNSTVSSNFKNMFEKQAEPWYDRNVSIDGPPNIKQQVPS